MGLLTSEEFSKLPIDESKEYIIKLLNKLSDEDMKTLFEHISEDFELKKYLDNLD